MFEIEDIDLLAFLLAVRSYAADLEMRQRYHKREGYRIVTFARLVEPERLRGRPLDASVKEYVDYCYHLTERPIWLHGSRGDLRV